MKVADYVRIPTERANPLSENIDRVSVRRALRIINREDARVAHAVRRESKSLEKAIRLIVHSLRNGGRLFFLGAGTSGRLGILEAAECPPTFNTPPSLVQAFMAGGRSSVFRSKEGAEDDGSQARKLVKKRVKRSDVVVGIAASGVTEFVAQGLRVARQKKASTIFVTCNPKSSRQIANVNIAVNTGPEVITGSTRLKAGTATKLVLNTLTVVSMAQLGKVFGNRMVDLQPRSKKLKARAINLIKTLGKVSEQKAQRLLAQSKGNAKIAILMALRHVPPTQAHQMLKKTDGHLYRALKA